MPNGQGLSNSTSTKIITLDKQEVALASKMQELPCLKNKFAFKLFSCLLVLNLITIIIIIIIIIIKCYTATCTCKDQSTVVWTDLSNNNYYMYTSPSKLALLISSFIIRREPCALSSLVKTTPFSFVLSASSKPFFASS